MWKVTIAGISYWTDTTKVIQKIPNLCKETKAGKIYDLYNLKVSDIRAEIEREYTSYILKILG